MTDGTARRNSDCRQLGFVAFDEASPGKPSNLGGQHGRNEPIRKLACEALAPPLTLCGCHCARDSSSSSISHLTLGCAVGSCQPHTPHRPIPKIFWFLYTSHHGQSGSPLHTNGRLSPNRRTLLTSVSTILTRVAKIALHQVKRLVPGFVFPKKKSTAPPSPCFWKALLGYSVLARKSEGRLPSAPPTEKLFDFTNTPN